MVYWGSISLKTDVERFSYSRCHIYHTISVYSVLFCVCVPARAHACMHSCIHTWCMCMHSCLSLYTHIFTRLLLVRFDESAAWHLVEVWQTSDGWHLLYFGNKRMESLIRATSSAGTHLDCWKPFQTRSEMYFWEHYQYLWGVWRGVWHAFHDIRGRILFIFM